MRIVQKYTLRKFTIAMWTLALKSAIKRLVKEKYPLTARLSTNLPDNMKVYSGHRLHVTSPIKGSSCPNSALPSPRPHASRHTQLRAASDSDLKNVVICDTQMPFVKVTVPSDDEDDLAEVKVTTATVHRSPSVTTDLKEHHTETKGQRSDKVVLNLGNIENIELKDVTSVHSDPCQSPPRSYQGSSNGQPRARQKVTVKNKLVHLKSSQ